MKTAPTMKTIGAPLAACALLLAAGCSSSEQESQEQDAPESSAESSAAVSEDNASNDTLTEMPEDMDFSQLLDGITYKGEQIAAYPPEQIEEYAQQTRDLEGVENHSFDPPECAEEFRKSEEEYIPEKMSPKTFTIGDLQTDGFSAIAYHRSVTEDPLADKVSDSLDKCENYSYTSEAGTMHITIEQLPFTANAEKGYSIIQRTESDGLQLDTYNTLAQKNGAIVNVNLTVPTDENIAAATETMNMILDRL
ncbi:hypothetical protein MHJ86_05625 [Corynebacterium afermentans]|nr:hypothetical protein [Corynebacterium afermentans]